MCVGTKDNDLAIFRMSCV